MKISLLALTALLAGGLAACSGPQVATAPVAPVAPPVAWRTDAGPSAPFTSEVARADVKREAVVAAHSPDPYADGYDAGVAAPIVSEVARSTVHAGAVEAARAPRLNIYGMAY